MSTHPRQPRTPRRPRAFALPLVLILALAGSLVIAVLLERQSTASLAVKRHLDAYQFHHVSGGMREMVSRWLKLVRTSVEDSVDEDGRAFTLELPRGYRVDVYAEDGQGAALTDVSQLLGRRREIVEFMSAYVQANARPEDLDLALRPAGPATISVVTAPRIVLEALAAACVEPDQVESVVQALARMGAEVREAGSSQVTTASNPLQDLNIPVIARQEIEALITTSPSIYRIICVERDPSGRINWRSGGLMDIGAARNAATYDQGGPFLTWEDLPIDPGPSR